MSAPPSFLARPTRARAGHGKAHEGTEAAEAHRRTIWRRPTT
jgi:hypothetical protein